MNPDGFSEGTGLFDDVDGAIVNVQFTTDLPENYTTDGANPLFANVSILLDGDGSEEERTVTQGYSLGAKSSENFTIGDDGFGLIPQSDHATVNKGTKWGIFMAALAKEGVTPAILNGGDMSKLIGLNAHWNRTADKERKGLRNQRAGGRPATTLVCTKIHALPGGKSTGKGAGKSNGADVATSDTGSLDDKCSTYLLDILASKDGKVQRSQLALLASKVALKDPQRLEISKRMADEAFLATNVAWKYDAASKGQLITA
jgi:hypothetical protein